MLEQLEVNNIALIANESIEFDLGLNVITGETGAGKSLLINSLGILLGSKMDKNLLRKDCEQCKVTGKFLVDENSRPAFDEFCEKYDFETADDVIVTRTFSSKGKSDIRINGQLSTLSMLKELSSIFVDAYFQNENQKIFNKSQHLQILDGYGQTEKLAEYIKEHIQQEQE